MVYTFLDKKTSFFLSGYSFTNIHESHDCRGRGRHFFNSSLPLPPASQTLRHQPGDYCRELTSAHSQQLDSNREPLVSERKSLTTKLHPLVEPLRLDRRRPQPRELRKINLQLKIKIYQIKNSLKNYTNQLLENPRK